MAGPVGFAASDQSRGPSLREVIRPCFTGTMTPSDSLSAARAFGLRLIRRPHPLKDHRGGSLLFRRRPCLRPVPSTSEESCVTCTRPVHGSRVSQSVAFAVTCAARPPRPFGCYSIEAWSGVHFRYGPQVCSLPVQEGFCHPARYQGFLPSTGVSYKASVGLTLAGLTPAGRRQLGRTRHEWSIDRRRLVGQSLVSGAVAHRRRSCPSGPP